ncbi:thiamine transport system ATP-binding protein [Ruegeria halocynthiae]|uniref:Thiamine transport system ATP-binding protein n=1 Tax=Ruegeria halocynthiae TaxID=985054 RepID=A0A1H2XP28_9RHOB|nr:ATP-binding cassette domain-containing protein [Ruegeria halocynthiae]SDW94617.1 thiamine transport system ATP-binding protein [Ruegeria halocynthiae]
MLKLDDCTISSGDFLLRADLEIEAGSSIAIIGPSGAGKSTLLETIAGFRDLKGGQIFWKGKNLTTLPPGKRPLAMLFQDGNLFPHLSAAQNVALGLRPNGGLSQDEHQHVQSALVRVGLPDLGARKPAELSGGQQSRVALARILVQKRQVLLLDEPFAALGPALKAEMLDLVASLVAESGTTLLMVSHDPQDALRITRQTVLVADQIAHPPVSTAQLFENPPPALRDYLG